MIKAMAFDVNETLLDLGAMRPAFAELIGSAEPMGEWFARMLHGSLVANHTGQYRPFAMLGIEALLVVAQKRQVNLSADQAADFVSGMQSLPPHPDVLPTLTTLAERGWRLITFTNGGQAAAEAQMTNSGIAPLLEGVLSVESVGRFKPAPETYLWAASKLNIEIDEMLMVAAHDWDVIGATSVGSQAAFIARPGAIWGVPNQPPEIVGHDLTCLLDIATP